MENCRTNDISDGGMEYVVPCRSSELGVNRTPGQGPKQAPFAVVIGCSDARVPTELLFGQGFNDLFIVRVAGNVLGDVCLGSIDYALHALSDSLKCIVVLGHLECGAVTAAVDAYLEPHELWTHAGSPVLRSIVQRIFVAVREADHGLEHVWGSKAPEMPGYRKALIDISVCVNSAQVAFDLQREVQQAGKRHIDVLYGVFNLGNHQVSMPIDPGAGFSPEKVNLAHAPTHAHEFHDLAVKLARILKP
jgi:carbonic anhydrase